MGYEISRICKDDVEKARAIYVWIAENIAYKKGSSEQSPKKVLKKGKAVCAGYSYLYEELCRLANVRCTTITGYAKNHPSDISRKPKSTNHAWNGVFLNNQWYLLDATWGAGHYEMSGKKKWVKELDNFWFLTDPLLFSKHHYPQNKKWFLFENPPRLNQFVKEPLYWRDGLTSGIFLSTPAKGLVKFKKGKPIELNFANEPGEKLYYTLPGNDKIAYPLEIKEKKGKNIYQINEERIQNGQITIFKKEGAVMTLMVRNQ